MTDLLVGMGRLAQASLYPVAAGTHWVADRTLFETEDSSHWEQNPDSSNIQPAAAFRID